MLLPEKNYQFGQHDKGGPLARIFNQPITGTAAASTSITATWKNVTGFIFTVGVISFDAGPGAAQNYVRGQVNLEDDNGNFLCYGAADYTAGPVATATRRTFYPGGGFNIPPLVTVRMTMVFNAGAAANSGQAFLHGLLFPRGSILF